MPEPISPVLDEVKTQEQIERTPTYSQTEIDYIRGLQIKLERARDMRDSPHDELDGMTYQQYWEYNEKGGNTYVEPKKNKEDSNFQSGTIRRKIFAFAAELLTLDYHADVTAFDQNDLEVRSLGNAIESIIEKTREWDSDEEKKLLRLYELLKHGDVFVEKVWDEKFIKQKLSESERKFDGKVKGLSWTSRLKRKFSRPTSNIIPGINVYLGNIREYDFSNQPYIFTVEIVDYAQAQMKYGEWERWDFVSETLKELATGVDKAMVYNNWRLAQFQKDKCEIIKYQDKWNNEFAIVINGVLMTPVGLPLPWGYDDYNIVQQHLKPIHAKFAYGSSLVKELRNNVLLIDDMIRIMHLKAIKSLVPPRANLTGRTISRRVFLPATITPGIRPDQVPLLDEHEARGPTQSEFAMVKELMDNVDKNSIGPIPSGQQPNDDPTATEVMEVSRASKTMLGVVVLSATLLEWKLSWQDLFLILENWFNPIDEKVDETRNALKKVYRIISVRQSIDGKGMGRKVVAVTDEQLPTAQEVRELEDTKEEETGTPHRFIFLNFGHHPA